MGKLAELDDDTRRRLVDAANSVAIRSAGEAGGKCFVSTMEFALACSLAKAPDLQLVRWTVKGDPDFCEHWSLAISDKEVIDLTRVQVDGNTAVLHHIDSYPHNYRQMTRYPASAVLTAHPFTWHGTDECARKRAALAVRWAMFRHDLRTLPTMRAVGRGLREYTQYLRYAITAKLLQNLEARRDMLRTRLERY